MVLKLVSLFNGVFPNVIIILGFTSDISSSNTSLKSFISGTLGGLLLIVILPVLPSFVFIGLKKHVFVILTLSRVSEIEFKYVSKVSPANPTKGLPCCTSVLPGASPTNKISQGIGPSPVIQPPILSSL